MCICLSTSEESCLSTESALACTLSMIYRGPTAVVDRSGEDTVRLGSRCGSVSQDWVREVVCLEAFRNTDNSKNSSASFFTPPLD